MGNSRHPYPSSSHSIYSWAQKERRRSPLPSKLANLVFIRPPALNRPHPVSRVLDFDHFRDFFILCLLSGLSVCHLILYFSIHLHPMATRPSTTLLLKRILVDLKLEK